MWKGSTLQLLGVIIFPLALFVLIIALGSTWLHQREMRAMVGERDEVAVRAAAAALGSEMHYRLALVQSFALQVEQSHRSAEQLLAAFQPLLANFDLGLALYSQEGSLLAFRGDENFWKSLQVEQFRESQQSALPRVYSWRANERTLVLFSALAESSSVLIVAGITLQRLADRVLMNALPTERETQIRLIDRQKTILYPLSGSELQIQAVQTEELERALREPSGTFYARRQGIEYVISYSSVPEVDWVLIMEEPWQAVASPILETTRIAPLVLVPLLLISLSALWFGARQIVQPLRELEKKSASLAWGDFRGIEETVGGIEEIRRLQAELRHMAGKVQMAQRSLRDYIGAITSAQEEERRRIARELHDDTLQSIIALKQRVQLAQKNALDQAALQSLQELETIADKTIENLRRTTRALRPLYLEELGLVTALEMLAREMESVSGIEISFRKEGLERRLSAAVELTLYRIAQEALSNVVRHAQATQATLRIHYQDPTVTLQILDDGKGFDVPETLTDFASAGHFGLLGMYERADLIGAHLSIESAPGRGTKLTIRLSQAM
ncbi:MAG: two-component sensor histidine kinase [Anaerolineae bacterium]|jgi:signal transduction histidine kinase|nr:MAG: two-component sensor histidine kinase [Anaerolineae bacterium]